MANQFETSNKRCIHNNINDHLLTILIKYNIIPAHKNIARCYERKTRSIKDPSIQNRQKILEGFAQEEKAFKLKYKREKLLIAYKKNQVLQNLLEKTEKLLSETESAPLARKRKHAAMVEQHTDAPSQEGIITSTTARPTEENVTRKKKRKTPLLESRSPAEQGKITQPSEEEKEKEVEEFLDQLLMNAQKASSANNVPQTSQSNKRKHSELMEQYTNTPPPEKEITTTSTLSLEEDSSNKKRRPVTHLNSETPLEQDEEPSLDKGKEKETSTPQVAPLLFNPDQKKTIKQNMDKIANEIRALNETPFSPTTLSRLQSRYNLANNESLTTAPKIVKSLKCTSDEKKPKKYKRFPNSYITPPITSIHGRASGAMRSNVLPGPKGEKEGLALAQYASVASIPFTNAPIEGQYTFPRVPEYANRDLRKEYLNVYYLPLCNRTGKTNEYRDAAKALIYLFSHFVKETIITGVARRPLTAMIDYELRKLSFPPLDGNFMRFFLDEVNGLSRLYSSSLAIESKFRLNNFPKIPMLPQHEENSSSTPHGVEIIRVKRGRTVPLEQKIDSTDCRIISKDADIYDKQTSSHKDTNKFPGKRFGFLSCFYGSQQKRYSGGYTILPEYGIGFDVGQGDCLIADFENIVHANTPIVPLDGKEPFTLPKGAQSKKVPNWHRASLVGYTRGSLLEKTERFSYENSDDESEQDFSAEQITEELEGNSLPRPKRENQFAFFMSEASRGRSKRGGKNLTKQNEDEAKELYERRNSYKGS